jgi:hypothetical protein
MVLAGITDRSGEFRHLLHDVLPRKIEKAMEPIGVAHFLLVREQLFAARREIVRRRGLQSWMEENQSEKNEREAWHEAGDLVASACLVQRFAE